jgi:hypothetical protein
MLSIIKDNPVSYGKDPNALAVATLYAASIGYQKKTKESYPKFIEEVLTNNRM